MSDTSPRPLSRVLELALFLRVLAACAVEWRVRRGAPGRVCLFPDAEYYWALAGTIRAGSPYEIVEWGDIPHFALRTPGYPLFLAACRSALGDDPLGVRVVQAGLGTLSVWLVYRLTREACGRDGRRSSAVPVVAAILAAVHPYFVAMSALVLSEALFVPLMLAALWGLAALWNDRSRRLTVALGVGAANGAAILVRPSWAPFVPIMVGMWVAAQPRERLRTTLRDAGLIVLGLVVVMAPWWARNARIYGRFIPTALWTGASLYDGLNPKATGASDMRFLEEPGIWALDELDQDAELTRRALAFAREDPGRALGLAVVKLGRFWSPWPNAEGFRSPVLALASSLVVVPVFACVAIGLGRRRGDARAWVLLAGPLFYFCALHMAFASSMRYRIPAEVPAMGLAAVGLIGRGAGGASTISTEGGRGDAAG
jgi:4-amino-4-deoxy-L-arabinose transferase-like glycosyltransferase